jgi:hypothetical protein
MPPPARRQDNNHELSIQKHVKDNFADTFSITVSWQDQLFDASGHDLWVDITFLSHGAGRKGETMVQFDVYSRVRGRQASGDELMSTLKQTVQRLINAMHVECIQVYDFAVPASPTVIAGARLMVQTSDGTFREPESDQFLGLEDGVARRSLTYRLRMLEDASRALSYYD